MFCVFYVACRTILFACKSSCACQLIIINENDDEDDDERDPGQLSQPWTLPMSLSLTSCTVERRPLWTWSRFHVVLKLLRISERTRSQRPRSAETNEQTGERLFAPRISTTGKRLSVTLTFEPWPWKCPQVHLGLIISNNDVSLKYVSAFRKQVRNYPPNRLIDRVASPWPWP